VIFELQLGYVFDFNKRNLAVMHSCSYCKRVHYKDNNDDQIFSFFKPWNCTDGTHINEEQNQNHELSTEYKPGIVILLESIVNNPVDYSVM